MNSDLLAFQRISFSEFLAHSNSFFSGLLVLENQESNSCYFKKYFNTFNNLLLNNYLENQKIIKIKEKDISFQRNLTDFTEYFIFLSSIKFSFLEPKKISKNLSHIKDFGCKNENKDILKDLDETSQTSNTNDTTAEDTEYNILTNTDTNILTKHIMSFFKLGENYFHFNKNDFKYVEFLYSASKLISSSSSLESLKNTKLANMINIEDGVKKIQSIYFKDENNWYVNFGEGVTEIIGSDNSLNKNLLKKFVASFSLNSSKIVDNLRNFFTSYQMKGETQMIDRILQELSNQMADQLPLDESIKNISGYKDSIFSVIFAVILLNTDLHHPDVVEKMPFASFEKNFRLVQKDENIISKPQLQEIYNDILKRELKQYLWQMILEDYSIINKSLFERITQKLNILLEILLSDSFLKSSQLNFLLILKEYLEHKNIFKNDSDISIIAKSSINFYIENIWFDEFTTQNYLHYENYPYIESLSSIFMQILKPENSNLTKNLKLKIKTSLRSLTPNLIIDAHKKISLTTVNDFSFQQTQLKRYWQLENFFSLIIYLCTESELSTDLMLNLFFEHFDLLFKFFEDVFLFKNFEKIILFNQEKKIEKQKSTFDNFRKIFIGVFQSEIEEQSEYQIFCVQKNKGNISSKNKNSHMLRNLVSVFSKNFSSFINLLNSFQTFSFGVISQNMFHELSSAFLNKNTSMIDILSSNLFYYEKPLESKI